MEELERARQKAKTRRTAIRIGIAALAFIALIVILVVVGGGSKKASTASSTTVASDSATTLPGATTVPGAATNAAATSTTVAFTYGTGACPAPDGSSPKTQTFSSAPAKCIDPSKTYTAKFDTTAGSFTITLDAKDAPGTVNNFVVLARYHYYEGIFFHRIIPNFVIQGGDPQGTGTGGPGYSFADELPAAGAYKVGSVAMANSGPDTNGSQFFIITGNDGASLPPQYSLFGQVTDGNDVITKIAGTGSSGGTPSSKTTINKVTITES
jgi:cyclophilin family peptidyl-prolyl cis-trans isomerase